MWQLLHASFWKFSKLSNSGIFKNWSTIDEVTTRNATAYFLGPLCTSTYIPRFIKTEQNVNGRTDGHLDRF